MELTAGQWAAVAIGVSAVVAAGLGLGTLLTGDDAGDTQPQSVEAVGLDSYACDEGLYRLELSPVRTQASAPSTVEVTWTDGTVTQASLVDIEGATALYTVEADEAGLAGAVAERPDGWMGVFHVATGPCSEPTDEPLSAQSVADEEPGGDGDGTETDVEEPTVGTAQAPAGAEGTGWSPEGGGADEVCQYGNGDVTTEEGEPEIVDAEDIHGTGAHVEQDSQIDAAITQWGGHHYVSNTVDLPGSDNDISEVQGEGTPDTWEQTPVCQPADEASNGNLFTQAAASAAAVAAQPSTLAVVGLMLASALGFAALDRFS